MLDIVVRGGTVHDGTGAPPRIVDIGVRDSLIVAIAPEIVVSPGEVAEVIDATGRIVSPGFVDIHSHFDGQATWDGLLEPSSAHGVTTVVMGNCGVGFAPVRPDGHGALIDLMEGVEDIPGAALAEGITWGWESFPEYLDTLGRQRFSIDVGTQIPHGALRSYVMERYDQANEPATPEQVASMARLVQEAVEAGAFGFSTSRTMGHRALDGRPVPGTHALSPELLAIGRAAAAGGGRIFEVAGSGLARSDDPAIVARELDWMGQVAAETGLTTTFILLQCHDDPDRWRTEMSRAAQWRQRGAAVVPLVAARPFGVLYGWDIRHPFTARPTYAALAGLPLDERRPELRRPTVRDAILGESNGPVDRVEGGQLGYLRKILGECFPLVGPPDYEPPRERSLGSAAEARGVSLEAAAYDALLVDDSLLYYPLYNYTTSDHSALYEQLQDPDAVVGLNDGGAHCGFICDASIPTYLLTHWVRDRSRGPRIGLAEAVRRLTSQTADLYGLADRGRIAVGLRADLNVIDLDALALSVPHVVRDLPAGGARLMQDAVGYDATIVAGTVTRRHGSDTGARPGRLLRRH